MEKNKFIEIEGSSNLASVAFVEPNVRMNIVHGKEIRSFSDPVQTLIIKFSRGDIYRYSGVSEDQVNAMLSAESTGKYFRSEIMNKYPTFRLSDIGFWESV